MKKTILFIGAGEYQLPGIIRAKEMGLTVIAIDGDSKAKGLKLADKYYVQDVKDVNKAFHVAQEHQIDGVLTIASDICLPTVAHVAQELSLPGLPPATIEIATNKYLMRKKFSDYGVPSPKFCNVKSLADLQVAIAKIGFPFVIKPVDNAGSRGVSVVNENDVVSEAFQHALKHSCLGEVIIEEYIEGIECTIEGMSYKGKTEILAVSQKKKPEGKYRVATDLIYPPDFPFQVIAEIKKVVTLAIKAMGIDWGPTHSEVIVTPTGKPVLVEIAARGGGFKVFSDLIFLVSGVEAVTETIKMTLGENPDISPKKEQSAVLHFFAPPPGILKNVSGLEQARNLKNVEIGLFKDIGDVIPPLATDGSRTGYLIAWAETRQEALKKVEAVENIVKFTIEGNK